MIKKIMFVAMGMGMLMTANADVLTPEQALRRVSADSKMKSMIGSVESNPVHIEATRTGDAAAYVFNSGTNGFVVLSADDIAYPMLGYSDSGKFDMSNISPSMSWWLGEYARQIEYVRENPAAFKTASRENDARKRIEPMITTKWDQGEPYYNDCPKEGNYHCYTGCVATSMAQVLNYFKYPDVGNGTVSTGGNTLNLSNQAFDWNNMLDNYVKGSYNDAQAAAVAYLMKACGYSVKMNYGTSASGTQSYLIVHALKKNFLYDGGITHQSRITYSGSEWEEKIYNSLSSGSPVIYNGSDPNEGGHSFICDGYDGDGFFHINWGWGGMADGYFTLNALAPEALGTGGGTGGGFSFNQGAVLDIKKPTGATYPEQPSNLLISGALTMDQQKGNTLYLGLEGYSPLAWMVLGVDKLNLALGLTYTNVETNEVVATSTATLGGKNKVDLQPGSYYPYVSSLGFPTRVASTVPSSLPDGTYKATLCGRDANHPNDPWVPVAAPYGYPNYVMVVKSGTTLTATTVARPKLSIPKASIEGSLYDGRYVTIKATIVNDTEYELTEAIALELLNGTGTMQFESGSVLMTIPAKTEVEKTWKVSLTKASGVGVIREPVTYTMSMYNEYSDEAYGTYGDVTMNPNPGEATVRTSAIKIIDSEKEKVKIGNVNYDIFVVKNKDDFSMTLTLSVTKGYFDSNIYVGISRLAPGATNATNTVPVIDEIFNQNVIMNTGDQVTLDIPVSFPEAEKGVIYYLNPRYYTSNSTRSLGLLRFWLDGSSGVDEIAGEDSEGAVEYYNLQGLRIDNPRKGELVVKKTNGKTSKIIY